MSDTDLTAWLRKCSSAIFLATDESVAADISLKMIEAADELTRLRARVAELEAENKRQAEKIESYATNGTDKSDAWDRLALEAQKRQAAERERDEARREIERLRGIADAASRYREEESGDTPRMWRGKKLQDLANDLDDALEQLNADV
jgi:hypothetical protein